MRLLNEWEEIKFDELKATSRINFPETIDKVGIVHSLEEGDLDKMDTSQLIYDKFIRARMAPCEVNVSSHVRNECDKAFKYSKANENEKEEKMDNCFVERLDALEKCAMEICMLLGDSFRRFKLTFAFQALCEEYESIRKP